VFLLQLGAVGLAGGEVVAWAIDVSRERAEDGWGCVDWGLRVGL